MSTPTTQPHPTPLPLSVAIVCKDNERTIGRTLDSIHGLAAEIVAIDSGSTDRTIDLLESRSARVIRHDWLGHVRTKQLALDACAQPWVLCLDSDESLLPPLRDALTAALRSPEAADPTSRLNGFILNRKTFYRGAPLNHAWQPEPRLRLVRRGCARWGGLDPHDKLELTSGRSAPLPGDLRHDSFESFAEHLRKQWSHASTMARSLHASGVRGSRASLLVSPTGAFFKQLLLKRGFLDGLPGWLAAASAASAALTKHAVLLELSSAPSAQADPTPRQGGPS
ncbi:MAG: glycosyltransferase family 2 protein [Phycisphaeraceae bacterium]|nr:glycosyltransferase family 2 protein [Phycisphaeraceae bacterium]